MPDATGRITPEESAKVQEWFKTHWKGQVACPVCGSIQWGTATHAIATLPTGTLGNPNVPATEITGQGLQRLRWDRYEIESYLYHPAALRRYVEQKVGPASAGTHLADLQKHFQDNTWVLGSDHIGDTLESHIK